MSFGSGSVTVGLSVSQILTNAPGADWRAALTDRVAMLERHAPAITCLWTSDRVLGPLATLEPLTLLGFLAAQTDRLRLGVAVLVLPVRNPVEVARLAATLDQLSAGRVVLGVGAGSPADLSAGGYPTSAWGGRYEQDLITTLDLLSGQLVSVDHAAMRLTGASVRPTPVQNPLPVWLAGHSGAAIRRAARLGSGWVGSGSASTIAFAESVKQLRRSLEFHERDARSFTVAKRAYVHVTRDGSDRELEQWGKQLFNDAGAAHRVAVSGSAAHCRGVLEELIDAGAQHLIIDPVAPSDGQIDDLLSDVLEPLEASLR